MHKFIYWKKSLLEHNNDFIDYTKTLYDIHLHSNDPDFIIHSNVNVNISDFQNIEFKKNIKFFNMSPHSDSSVSIPFLYELNKEYENNNVDYGPIPETHDAYVKLQKLLNLNIMIATINHSKPNTVIGVHTDTNRQLMVRSKEDFEIEKTKKYIVFLSPWQIGQVFMIGKSTYTNWKPGDMIEFKWFMPHATANASNYSRYLIYISGVLP